MIRQLGSHTGKQVIFGFDRYLLPELDAYRAVLDRFGTVVPTVDYDSLHYLTSAHQVCTTVQENLDCMGVLICGTGMGMSIAANKFRGVYAARCMTSEDAEMARTINNANVLCLASKMGLEHNTTIIEQFMTVPFEGRKLEQLECIGQMELERHPATKVATVRVPRILRQTA